MAIQKRVILCAGHGGGDSGAVGQGTTEADQVIDITNRAVRMLQEAGVEVHLVPHSLGLTDSINWVNARWKDPEAGIAAEIHKNSGGGTGSEVWTPSYPDGDAMAYSTVIANEIAAATGQPNRGVKQAQHNRWGRLGWCDDTNVYACLIEAGFIDRDPVGPEANERYARGIANGFLKYFGVNPAPKAPAVTAEQIRLLFLEILGREPDDRGMKYYLDRTANHGWSIHRVREDIWNSPEANQYRDKQRKAQEEAQRRAAEEQARKAREEAERKRKEQEEAEKQKPDLSDITKKNAELETRVSALEKLVNRIIEFLSSLFKGFKK